MRVLRGQRRRSPRGLACSCAAALFFAGWGQASAQAAAQPCAGSADVPPQAAPPHLSARVIGIVVDTDGVPLAGAKVTLFEGALTAAETVSDAAGTFDLPNLPPGAFSVLVTIPGFMDASGYGVLQAGATADLGRIVLGLAVVHISVNAITPEQAALETLHAEEHQRLAGVLPNFFVSYNWTAPPLTARQKFVLTTHNVLDPGNLALVATVAGVQQAANAFPGYHQGAAGYGRRFGADLGNLVDGSYLGGAVLPSLFHQDPRYFYKGTGSLRSRAFYAISRAVITRGDNGRNQPNFSGVLGDLSAAAVSNAYYPSTDREGATLFFENGILAIAGDALNNLAQEFFLNRVTVKGKKPAPKP